MLTLTLILLILSVVCFAIAAFNAVTTSRVNFIGLGLMFWVLVPLINTIVRMANSA